MKHRIFISGLLFLLAFVCIIGRLAYWQIVKGPDLAARADNQYFDSLELPAQRGEIQAQDKSALVGSIPTFLVYAYKPRLSIQQKELAEKLTELLFEQDQAATTPSQIVQEKIRKEDMKKDLRNRLERPSTWELLARKLSLVQKSAIELWNVDGVGFQPSSSRYYPDASASAHVLGFVGNDTQGQPKGYFGLEGYYDRELRGASGIVRQERDALGNPILVGNYKEISPQPGKTLVTNIDRYVQRIVEVELKAGLEKYGAIAAEAVVMDPKTGAIIASASYPNYDPNLYWKFDQQYLKNPTISEAYEPGSTFKVVIMASALDAGVVEPDTQCDACAGVVRVGQYTIGTWDGQYRPNITMNDAIVHSDNTGMVFAARKLGQDKLIEYIKKFGFGQPTGIDLQEETSPILRSTWREVDVATASFGQGIAVTTMQMLRAVGVIANKGVMMTPQVVSSLVGDKTVVIKPKQTGRVISEEASNKITDMMVNAVIEGEAKFAAPKGYRIAGKTGTAQIPIAGHYDEDKTIASFVGFAPADDPKFVMITKIREPKSSQWGSETAAPLWFSIAKKLLFYWSIPASE